MAVAVTTKEFVAVVAGPLYDTVGGDPGTMTGDEGTSATITVTEGMQITVNGTVTLKP